MLDNNKDNWNIEDNEDWDNMNEGNTELIEELNQFSNQEQSLNLDFNTEETGEESEEFEDITDWSDVIENNGEEGFYDYDEADEELEKKEKAKLEEKKRAEKRKKRKPQNNNYEEYKPETYTIEQRQEMIYKEEQQNNIITQQETYNENLEHLQELIQTGEYENAQQLMNQIKEDKVNIINEYNNFISADIIQTHTDNLDIDGKYDFEIPDAPTPEIIKQINNDNFNQYGTITESYTGNIETETIQTNTYEDNQQIYINKEDNQVNQNQSSFINQDQVTNQDYQYKEDNQVNQTSFINQGQVTNQDYQYKEPSQKEIDTLRAVREEVKEGSFNAQVLNETTGKIENIDNINKQVIYNHIDGSIVNSNEYCQTYSDTKIINDNTTNSFNLNKENTSNFNSSPVNVLKPAIENNIQIKTGEVLKSNDRLNNQVDAVKNHTATNGKTNKSETTIDNKKEKAEKTDTTKSANSTKYDNISPDKERVIYNKVKQYYKKTQGYIYNFLETAGKTISNTIKNSVNEEENQAKKGYEKIKESSSYVSTGLSATSLKAAAKLEIKTDKQINRVAEKIKEGRGLSLFDKRFEKKAKELLEYEDILKKNIDKFSTEAQDIIKDGKTIRTSGLKNLKTNINLQKQYFAKSNNQSLSLLSKNNDFSIKSLKKALKKGNLSEEEHFMVKKAIQSNKMLNNYKISKTRFKGFIKNSLNLITRTLGRNEDVALMGLSKSYRYTKTAVRITNKSVFISKATVSLLMKPIISISRKTYNKLMELGLKNTKPVKAVKNLKAAKAAKREIKKEVKRKTVEKIGKSLVGRGYHSLKNAAYTVSSPIRFITAPFKGLFKGIRFIDNSIRKIFSILIVAAVIFSLIWFIFFTLLNTFNIGITSATQLVKTSMTNVVIANEDEIDNIQNAISQLDVLEEEKINSFVKGGPKGKDANGNKIKDYGSPDNSEGYTIKYVDGNNNTIGNTSNMKDLLCIATVMLNNDFSDEDAVTALLNDLYEISHPSFKAEESSLYFCNYGCSEIHYLCYEMEGMPSYNTYGTRIFNVNGCSPTSNTSKDKNGNVSTTTTAGCIGHTQKVCYGHRNVDITVQLLSKEDLYKMSIPSNKAYNSNIEEFIEAGGWTNSNMEWVNSLYEQDWNELYGINVSAVGLDSSSSISQEELDKIIASLPADADEKMKEVVAFAASCVGKIPYYYGGYATSKDFDSNNFGSVVSPDEKGRTRRGLDCSHFVDFVYWNVTGNKLSQGGTAYIWDHHSYSISESELQIGDVAFKQTPSDPGVNHIGIYAGTNKRGEKIWIHCNGTDNNVAMNNVSYWRYYRRIKYW